MYNTALIGSFLLRAVSRMTSEDKHRQGSNGEKGMLTSTKKKANRNINSCLWWEVNDGLISRCKSFFGCLCDNSRANKVSLSTTYEIVGMTQIFSAFCITLVSFFRRYTNYNDAFKLDEHFLTIQTF